MRDINHAATSASVYPRVYRVPKFWRIFSAVVAIAYIILWTSQVSFLFSLAFRGWAGITFLVAALFVAGVLIAGALYAQSGRLVLQRESIDLIKPWGNKMLARENIAGRCRVGKTKQYLRFIAKAGARSMTIDMPFETDNAYDQWVTAFPDLDAGEPRLE